MPSLEFAPYNKIPSGRTRHDGRQGTIDQDPEFIDFLQSLTEPITKTAANGEAENKQEKVTTTPLVQYIKEKKANKAKEKEVAAAKAGKKTDIKDTKTATPSKSEQQPTIKKGTTSEAEKARVAKATQDVVKAINTLSKSAVAAQQVKATPAKPDAPVKVATTPATTTPQPTPKRERQRGDANAAARIISRDLGLTPKEGRSSKATKAVSNQNPTPTPPTPTILTPSASKTPVPSTSTAAPSQPAPQPPTGPRTLRNSTPQQSPVRTTPTPPVQQPAQRSNTKPSPQPSSGAKSAFLKHANPSQGITEELLRTTFSAYGTITRCEIDKKKGLGYLDFTEPEALKKAMAASPVKIANGSVVVLENRSPYRKTGAQPSAQTKGNTAATSSTGVVSSPKIAQATLNNMAEVIASPSKPIDTTIKETSSVRDTPLTPVKTALAPSETSEIPSTPLSPTAATTPAQSQTPVSAPRGGGRGGRGHHRGRGGFRGRGGNRGGSRTASTATGNGATTPSTPTAAAGDSKG